MANQKTLDARIKGVLNENVLSAFFIVQGINLANQAIDAMTNEELYKHFCTLYHPQDIRRFYRLMAEKLNNNDG